MHRIFIGCCLACLATIALPGCSEPEATNVAESVSDEELDSYEAALAEEDAMMTEEEMGDENDN